ncbi:hypothetical protein [Streptomyces sp. NPDC006335]|uniref:hypothetical protein n=1 Tax=Streptomyces sp. NPDC006335 TaxID=3156895 RepID=UPI0033A0014F
MRTFASGLVLTTLAQDITRLIDGKGGRDGGGGQVDAGERAALLPGTFGRPSTGKPKGHEPHVGHPAAPEPCAGLSTGFELGVGASTGVELGVGHRAGRELGVGASIGFELGVGHRAGRELCVGASTALEPCLGASTGVEPYAGPSAAPVKDPVAFRYRNRRHVHGPTADIADAWGPARASCADRARAAEAPLNFPAAHQSVGDRYEAAPRKLPCPVHRAGSPAYATSKKPTDPGSGRRRGAPLLDREPQVLAEAMMPGYVVPAAVRDAGEDARRRARPGTADSPGGTPTPRADTETDTFTRSDNVTLQPVRPARTKHFSLGGTSHEGAHRTSALSPCRLCHPDRGPAPTVSDDCSRLPCRPPLSTQTNPSC